MRFIYLFCGMSISYVILGINIRALSRGKMKIMAVTEFTYAMINFGMIRYVAEAKNWHEAFAYASGATLGCLTSIWLTKHWEG